MSERLKEVAFDALREMYEEAEPPLDFDHAVEHSEEYPDDWYSHHYLDSDRQREIVESHCDQASLSEGERTPVFMTAILHYGPASIPPEGVDV